MDIIQAALAHASAHDGLAYGLAAAAGLLTSVGPCVAPRYLAVASMRTRGSEGIGALCAFAAGTMVAYLCIAVAGSFVMRIVGASPFVYGSVAAILMFWGVRTVVVGDGHACEAPHMPLSAGGSFLFGAASSIVISPCCTPVLVAFGGLSAGLSAPLSLAGLVALFTLGHLAPVAIAAACGSAISRALARHRDAMTTINAALLIALGCYYAVLA